MGETYKLSEADCMEDGDDYIEKRHFRDASKPKKIVKGIIVYRCTDCGQYKPRNEYYNDKRVPCGIRNKCKLCYHKKQNGKQ